MKKNYKLLIQYDGSRYYGWEHQPDQDTVQGRLEEAVLRFYGKKAEIIGAGRTDAGVHARGMCANVFLDVPYTVDELRRKWNECLPEDIAVVAIEEASPRFHARYSAVGKTYQYTCHYGSYPAVFRRKYVYELDYEPDLLRMKKAAGYLVGEHDFKAFCKQCEPYDSTVRLVDAIDIAQQDGYITFTVHGTGFLRNMVRILVGTLLDVGRGKIDPEDIPQIIESRERERAGHTAKAMGLCLVKVDYE
ncbi:MAG: tRNA pseudouridine(38-40) synthase TruA [Lachnospiraceae bacterium]